MSKIKAEFKKVSNGYSCTVDYDNGEDPIEFVYQEVHEDEHKSFLAFLNYITDMMGPSDEKWGTKAIQSYILPGRKWEGKLEEIDKKQLEEMEWLYSTLKDYFEPEEE